MPRFSTHFAIGLGVGAAVNTLCQWNKQRDEPGTRFDFGELCLCSLAAGAGAIVPDLLEPADSPNHRQFFHSVAAAALVAYLISGGHTHRLSPIAKLLLAVFGFGYISHLLADALTPKSLPFIGRL
jgi:inner membrane protein